MPEPMVPAPITAAVLISPMARRPSPVSVARKAAPGAHHSAVAGEEKEQEAPIGLSRSQQLAAQFDTRSKIASRPSIQD
jgi:hypothetical protein